MSDKIIPIVFSTDDNYVLPLSVAIQSIKNTIKSSFVLKIYVLCESLTEKSIDTLKLLQSDNCEINIKNISEFTNGINFITHGRLNKTTWYRIYACELFKGFDKILYLDCDVLINKSISDLFKIDVKNYLLCGVYDWGFIRQDIFVTKDYVNAGVILFNVKECNNFDFSEKCLTYASEHSKLPWMDQDVINNVSTGRIKNVGNEFDFMTFYVYDYKKQKSRLKQELKYQKLKSVKDIVVIHYTGEKPWKIKNLPLSNLWWKTVKTLPTDIKKEIKNKYGNKPIIYFVGRHIPYKGIDYLIKASQLIKNDCVILIAGTGPQDKYLKSLPCGKQVHFLGRLSDDDLRCYSHAADIFAFSSVTKAEAFGIALAEAMYCESVPITFTIQGSGVNWVSTANETGEQVPLKNISAFAAAIDKIISNPDLKKKYAKASKQRILNMFTTEKAVQAMLAAYHSLEDLGI